MHPTRRELVLSSLGLGAAALAPRWEIVGQDGDLPESSERVRRFEQLGFGLFVHWGLYSQLAAGEWAKHFQGLETSEYMELMKTFTAAKFSGRDLARVAKRAGMRYVTLTSRHHDGFSLYDTRGLSQRDVTHTPAGRDLIGDFVTGCREQGIVPMLYCTTLDWTDERFENDWSAYQQYLRASVELLCTHYGQIGGFWFDGNWSRKDADWELDALYGTIRRLQPEALIINNTGLDAGGALGHPEIDSVTFERGRPQPIDRRGMDKYVSGEMCHTFNFHWGIAEKDFNYLSPAHVIEELIACRAAGANLLMNVGPMASGRVPDYEQAALTRVGDWIDLLGEHREVLFRGRPAGVVGEQRDVALELEGTLYLFVHDLTATANSAHGVAARGAGPRRFTGPGLGDVTSAHWLDNGEELEVERDGDALVLKATKYPYGTNTVVRVAKVERAS